MHRPAIDCPQRSGISTTARGAVVPLAGQPGMLSRRAFLASAAAAGVAAWMAPSRARAQDSPQNSPEGRVPTMRRKAETARITVEKLRGGVSVLSGSGGNIAVLTGRDGKLLVDAGMAGSKTQVAEALAGVGGEPIRRLINTHWHFDHCDGNEWLHEAGAEIVAHENTRRHLGESTRVPEWEFTFPPSPAAALPTVAVKVSLTLHCNGQTVEIDHLAPAHTDGDLYVRFAEADILHLGDTFWNGHYPFIDCSNGGGINLMIRAAEQNLARIGEKTVLIPGHGPVGSRRELAEFRDVLATIRDRVAELKKQGKSLEQVQAARPTARFDEKWGGFAINGDLFARLVYQGV